MTKKSKGKPPAERRTYHHGDLQDALIRAAEKILAEDGIETFSLREAARRAGVSAAAPAHHFESATGLLTEVAARGFEELARRLAEANATRYPDAASRLHALGLAYARFALAFPGRFELMFRRHRLKQKSERLQAASRAARAELEKAVSAYVQDDERAARTMTLAAWSAVHGFATLAIEGKFDGARGAANLDAFAEKWLPEMLTMLFPAHP